MRTQIKVCGLRRIEDVDVCLELGVDLLGFNCWSRSPRYVTSAELSRLVTRVEGRATVVLVVVDAEPDGVRRLLEDVPVFGAAPSLQLHGGQDPSVYAGLDAHVVQVLRLGASADVPEVKAERVLLDVHHADFGGTGRSLAHADVEAVRSRLPREWMLAGGLDASNVAAAIEALRPWGVDVASGVESAPGVKDTAKLQAFVHAVRGVERTDAS